MTHEKNSVTANLEDLKIPTSIKNTEAETEIIKQALIIELAKYFSDADDQIYIENRSAGHRNHQIDAGGHYYIQIISQQFINQNIMTRQRFIYQILKGWLPQRIHSIELDLKTIDESFEN